MVLDHLRQSTVHCLSMEAGIRSPCYSLSPNTWGSPGIWRKGSVTRSVMSNSLRPHVLWPTRFLCPWVSLGKSTGVGCHSLLQGIFPTQGSNPGLPTLQADSLPSEPPGKSRHLSQVIIIYWWVFSKINFSSFISWVKRNCLKITIKPLLNRSVVLSRWCWW